MESVMIDEALNVAYTYLAQRYASEDLLVICRSLNILANKEHNYEKSTLLTVCSYENVQDILSNLNEKEDIRKSKGVYYTPSDVVRFMLYNSMKAANNKLKPTNLHVLDLNGVSYRTICNQKSVFDPTCGAGVFLLASLDIKFDLLDANVKNVSTDMIKKIVATIYGNDVNVDSTTITKIRLYLCALHRYGLKRVIGIETILNNSFYNYDFVQNPVKDKKYDIVIGNPPYVEDSKSGLNPEIKYGNIYANVLKNAADILSDGGVFSFIIPLSYISTPRMKSIRDDLFKIVPEQYILSYSDRPDCLFASVHQKLCILLSIKKECPETVYTSNYRYWYKENRNGLFTSTEVIKHTFGEKDFIPKIGTTQDKSIYAKIKNCKNSESFYELSQKGTGKLYLNMRAAFWIKAFLEPRPGSEYKTFEFENENVANYISCLLNSSLFWWYWICVSDCWHITRKELSGFRIPIITDFRETNRLAQQLENRLEETKVYVGTKQVEYEYKHKDCTDEIHEIDDFVNALFGLTDSESVYVKNFAYRYRIGGGAEVNENESD